MRSYASPRIRELKAQITYAGRDVRSRYAQNLEQLLPEISDRRAYPYDYIFFRITGFHAAASDGQIPGAELRRDLSRLLDELTFALKEPPDGRNGPVLGYTEIAERCHVSERTLRRWRRKGLPLRWFILADGRMGKGIRLNALRRFVRRHRGLVADGARFSRMIPQERDEIIDLAAQLKRCGQGNITRISKEIGFLFGRAPETIRRILRRHLFAPKLCITGPIVHEVAGLYRDGVSVPELCRRYGKSRSAVYSAVRADKVVCVLSGRVRFVQNPDFELVSAERRILANGLEAIPKMIVPEAEGDADAYMAAVSHMPVLTTEQERRLFLRYNYAKFRMARAQEALGDRGYRAGQVQLFEQMSDLAERAREQLIKCNLRLVASIARRHAGPLVTFADLMSTGALVLMRAVETFDCARGNKFSTYLTWAVTKEFARRVPEENYRLATFITGEEELLEAGDGRVSEESVHGEALAHLGHLIGKALGALNALEREVIKARFGLLGLRPMTLNEIGAGLGLTAERIRQIQNGALGKLRRQLGQDGVEALPG